MDAGGKNRGRRISGASLQRFIDSLSWSPPADPRERDRIGEQLEAVVTRALAAHPSLTLEIDPFLTYLADRLSPTDDLPAALAQIRAADLYLAYGCALGVGEAMSHFERKYVQHLESALSGFGDSTGVRDDVRDKVRQEILFARGERPPKISEYGGHGDLRRWLRVVAVRAAVDWSRRAKRERLEGDDNLWNLEAPGGDPELAFFKRHYRREFKEIFGEAMNALSKNQRNLLRYYHLDGLTLEQIAILNQVHFTTIRRRIEKARVTLLSETRRRFFMHLGVPASEFESIMRVIESQLDVSIARHFEHSSSSHASPSTPPS